VIVTYAAPEGRRVVLADANPGIIGLRTATLLGLEEAQDAAAAGPGPGSGRPAGARLPHPEPSSAEPPPNLGPPPERLDWRKPR
jgi:hypothetical protein